MKTTMRKVSTVIDGKKHSKIFQAVFPESTEEIFKLFSKDDALTVFNQRLEVVQDNRARTELINEHTPKKPKKSVKRISYEKLYKSTPKEIPVDNEHLKDVLKKNRE